MNKRNVAPKRERVKSVELLPVASKAVTEKGGSLEVLMWKGQPAVLVDGKYLIRYTTLATSLQRATIKNYTGHTALEHAEVSDE